ncbi:ankyrin repeat domain-containing protein [bacterium]|nr:ankyrin repeat domain-containing protein [bacterium]
MSKKLLQAVLSNQIGDVDKLLRRGEDPNFRGADGLNSIDIACENEFVDILSLLLRYRANLNLKDSNGYTTLMKASMWNDKNSVIDTLLSHCSDSEINFQGVDGKTALMLAAQNGNNIYLKRLLDKRAKLEIRDSDGCTALIYSIRNRNSAGTEMLIEKGANLYVKDNQNWNILFWGVDSEPDNTDWIKFCISKGISITDKDINNLTIIDLAPSNSFSKLFFQELKSQDDFKQFEKMVIAIKNRDSFEVERRVSQLKNIDIKDEDGLTLLAQSVMVKHNISVVKLLVESGANVNSVDNRDVSILMYASMTESNVEVVRYLVSKGANVAFCNKKEKTVFDYAIDDSYSWLNIGYSHLNLNRSKSNSLNSNNQKMESISDSQKSINQTINFQNSGNYESKIIFDEKKESEFVLKEILKGGDADFRAIINSIEKGVNPNLVDEDNVSILMYSCSTKNGLQLVKKLIQLGANINKTDSKGKTAIFYAVMISNNIETIQFLIQNGAKIDIITPKNKNIFDFALDEYFNTLKNPNLSQKSVNQTINFQNSGNYESKTIFDEKKESEFLLKEILKGGNADFKAIINSIDKGVNPNLVDEDDVSILMHSCSTKNGLQLVKKLIQLGANIDKVDSKGKTALFYAVMIPNNTEIIQFLIQNGAKKNIITAKNKTVFDFALDEYKNILL